MKRRRRRAPGVNPAPLLLVALLLAAVFWATYPRRHVQTKRHTPRHAVSYVTPRPTATPVPVIAPTATPAATAAPAATATSVSPVIPGNGKARLAIIIDDSGQWRSTEQSFIALPIPLTMAVLPHVRYTASIAQDAADAGKGVMLHLPMEPLSHANPGPGEISTTMSNKAIAAQAEDDVAQVPLAKGVNNHEGSEASADARVMDDVMNVVKDHGLFFIDSRTNAKTVAAQTARDDGVPQASRDVFLDDVASVAYTESMLDRAAEIAKRKGTAIAIGHPKPTTLAALQAMYPKLQAEGVTFVLAEDLVH